MFLSKLDKIELVISQHSITEFFNHATKVYKIPSAIAKELILFALKQSIQVIELNPKDYFSVNDLMIRNNLTGAKMYDALVLTTAYKANVDKVVTYDVSHYLSLSGNNHDFIITPN